MKNVIVLMLLVIVNCAYSQEYGEISMDYYGEESNDLYNSELDLNKDKILDQIELGMAYDQGIDLSTLNPIPSDVWNPKYTRPIKEDTPHQLDEQKVFKYVDMAAAPLGAFNFLVRDTSSDLQKNFSVWLSKDSRTILLKRNLLRKLGYFAPRITQVQNLKIKFNGLISLKQFIDKIKANTFGDPARWVINKDEDSYILTLQDVLVLDPNDSIYNLVTGKVTEDIIKGRRAFNALAVPFLLVNVKESVDGLPWSSGRISNKQFRMSFHGASEFTTTYADARWILNRLAKLTQTDLKDIVSDSHFPDSVSLLLVEKLKSRLNSLYTLFNIDTELYKVNELISSDDKELVKGRLTQNKWEGHASRYSFEDTESPFTTSEILAFFRSKLNSSVISNLVTQFNDKVLFSTDIQKEAIAQQLAAKQKQINEVISSGQYSRIPFSTWGIPTLKVNAFVSRDIITGSYLGTDNNIQIADSLEVMGDIGYFVGTLGLAESQQLFGSANARYSRTYSHVKSIKSMKKALKEEYRNIIIPYLTRNKANHLSRILTLIKDPEFLKLEDEERKQELVKILNNLKKVLAIGESLIVSDNYILSGTVNAGVHADVFSSAVLNMRAKRVNISRYHILRKDENSIQIYKSYAKSRGYGFGFQFNYYIPVISLNWDNQKGSIKTTFNSINISSELSNDELKNNLSNLYQAMYHRNMEVLNAEKKPYVIKHKFREHLKDESVLFLRGTNIKMADEVTIVHPKGYESKVLVRSVGQRKGKDYQQFAVDALNALIKFKLEPSTDIVLSNPGSGNPGDSFKGSSYSRSATLELPKDKSELSPFSEFLSIHSKWKGWSANRAKMSSIAKDITKLYGKDVIDETNLAGMQTIDMYAFDVYLSLYQDAIDHLIDQKKSVIKRTLNKHFRFPYTTSKFREHHNSSDLYLQEYSYARKRRRLINRAVKSHSLLKKGKLSANNRSFHLLRLVNTLNLYLPIEKFNDLIGGVDNSFIKANVSGFRGGMEDGEKPLILNTLGEVGSEHPGGALETIKNAIGITSGELGASWFIRRIQ